MITAFALIDGANVILTDPIFQGVAISLMFGVFVSTARTLLVIPLGTVSASKSPRNVATAPDARTFCGETTHVVWRSPGYARQTSR